MRAFIYVLAVLATTSSVFGIRGALYRTGRSATPAYGKQMPYGSQPVMDFLRFGRSSVYGAGGLDYFSGPLSEYYTFA
ncbi:hypothetical protein RB195_010265 [Necator americanus]|uniref:Uncharacterized protein n=1 Tax=Necator americanus TaxID=51031 RepID=A0ABR1CX64_NECAM